MGFDSDCGLQLRGELALAARVARRFFPMIVLLVKDRTRAASYDLLIAMAESFAEGRPGRPETAEELAVAVAEREVRLFEFEPPAWVVAVTSLGLAATRAFRVERSRLPDDDFFRARQFARQVYADDAVLEALHVDVEPLTRARDRDLSVLRKTHCLDREPQPGAPAGSLSLLGMGIDLLADLGPLWPDAAPAWATEGHETWLALLGVPQVRAKSGAYYLNQIDDPVPADSPAFEAPDLLCWYAPDITHERQLRLVLDQLDDAVRRHRTVPWCPSLIVYAPNANDGQTELLARHGAIVYTKLPGRPPDDEEALCAYMAKRMRTKMSGWTSEDAGWSPLHSQARWHAGVAALNPSKPARVAQKAGGPWLADVPIEESAENYRAVVGALTEGWPRTEY